MDDEYFKNYRKVYDKIEGIPGMKMNAPPGHRAAFTGVTGLELEMEAKNNLPREGTLDGITGRDTGARWTTHDDGSLRGSSIEYVLSQPCSRDEIEPMVEALFMALTKHKTVLINSNRCSTHVHKNISGKTVNLITSALAVFCTFEDVFIPWCGEERVNNHFCLANRDSPVVVNAWNNYLKTGSQRWSRDLKYSALNLVPIFDRGSMEVRCGPVPDSADKVVKWVKFVDSMFEYAFKEFENPQSIAYALSERGGYAVFQALCGKENFPIFMEMTRGIDQGTIDRMAIEGFRRCQALVLGHPWDKWMELINREYVPNPFERAKKKPNFGEIEGLLRADRDEEVAPRFRADRDDELPRHRRGVRAEPDNAVQWEQVAPVPGAEPQWVRRLADNGGAQAGIPQVNGAEEALRMADELVRLRAQEQFGVLPNGQPGVVAPARADPWGPGFPRNERDNF